MIKERTKRIHLISGCLIGASIVIAGVCLMAACVSIYRSGEQPFSRQAVSAAFAPIALPVYMCLMLVIIGFILDLCLAKDKRRTHEKQYSLILKRQRAKADMALCNTELRNKITHEQKSRLLHKGISAALLVICSLVFLFYALDGSHFHPSDINASMIKAMYILLPCMAIPFCYGIFAAFHARCSIQKEIELLKLAPVAAAKQEIPAVKQSDRTVLILRIALLSVGTAILVYGLLSGGTADVLTKAINICTECVGLG